MTSENRQIQSPPTIMIIEDSEDDYEATVRALNKRGNFRNELIHCEDGDEALGYLKRCKAEPDNSTLTLPNLILLDLNLPGMHGRTVLEEIKSDKDFKNIPVIILTTSEDPRDIETCYDAGANTYIVKPVELDKFMVAIQNLQEYWFEVAILPRKG